MKALKERTLFRNDKGYVLQITLGKDETTGKLMRKSFIGDTINEVRARENALYFITRK